MDIEDIYNYYFKDIYLYTLSISGDKQVAEDITSETFIKAMRSLNNFKGTCDIRVWLCQIAKNSYISYLRKSQKLIYVDTIPEQKDKNDLVENLCKKEDSMKIHEILHNLGNPYKEVFTLRVFGELSFKQIANLFGKTDSWACVTFYRAKNKIKEEMEDR